ncbi:MAG: outer-membrane lipoprotein carrier protein LolA [Muribaculaceae bacterium]|nr:outer-membrane lipoprotein carrier protein LolA [Muribaculaceae bacterium]
MQTAVAKVKGSNSVSAKFTVKYAQHSTTGDFKARGKKFRLKVPGAITWYDGKYMWTLSEATGEVTLVNPGSQEIAESNPFSYLDSYVKDFNVYKSKRTDTNNHLILLNPKTKKSDVKAIEIAINKKSLLPVRFIIRDKNDAVTQIQVSELNLTSNSKESDFKFDAKSHPDYQIIDLR